MDNKREGTNERKEGEDVGKFDGHGNEFKRAGTTKSPKVISSPLVSPTATINMPHLGPLDIDVAATFGVPLTTVGDLHMLINDIKVGKNDELLSGMTNDDHMETMDALGARAKDQPKVNSNFRLSVVDPVFDGVNISIPHRVVKKVSTHFEHTLYGFFIGKRMVLSVVDYYARNNWAKHGMKKIMINSKGFFFFKFDSRASLEVVLEGGPWLILFEEDGISLIIFIDKPVMLDSYTSSMCNDSWGMSNFAWCLIEVNSKADLMDVVTIGVHSLTEDDFTKETIHVEYKWRPPRCDVCKIFSHVHDHCSKTVVSPAIVITSNVVTPTVEKTNDGFQTVSKKKKKKGKFNSTNGGQFTGPSIKQNIRYEPKALTSAPKKRTTNVGNASNSSSMLKITDEEEEDVENMYDETANLFTNTKMVEVRLSWLLLNPKFKMSNANPPDLNSKFKNFQDVTVTAYITNFPTSLDSKDLWQHCEKHGTVTDVYIARKLSKVGRRFAFVRFLKVKDPRLLIEALNKIWIGSYHLFAATARFERKPNATPKPSNKPSTKQTNTQPKSASSSSHANPNRSYVNALIGKASYNPPNDKVILKSVTLDAADLLVTSNLSNVVLAKVRDVHLILNINNVLNKEGFYGFQCKYIGGMWLWIEFDIAESCQKLHQNSEMSWYFTAMKHVTHSFKADERIVWIEIYGLPLNAWTSKAFKKIDGSWGEPLFMDEDPQENASLGHVCIRTRIHSYISETCKVMIQEKSHNVCVKEFAGWVPDIKVMESKSSKNFEANNSVDDDFNDNVNDRDPNEVEEGEIHVVNDDHENDVVQDTQWLVDVDEQPENHADSPIILENHMQDPIKPTVNHNDDSESFSKPLALRASNVNRLLPNNNPHPLSQRPNPQEATSLTPNCTLIMADSLSSLAADFGPIPFKFYNSCLLDSNLQEMVKDSWNTTTITLARTLFYEMEIRNGIWDCGSDKASGPDEFSFAFYKKFWDSLKYDIMGFVQEFFKSSSLPHGCNASFIALIPKVLANRLAQVIDSVICQEQTAFVKNRQILDGPLMVSEAIQWCKRKHSKLLVFKIDFENAFDSISWDFLFQVMRFMGFNDTWINWISGCLNNATSSILINGSPTREFNIQRGLRQGDPLSPFLFIIAMEGLQVAIEDAIVAGLYRGLKVRNISLSYLFFADEAVFIGDWLTENISSLVSILECFHKKASMLSIGGRATLVSSVLGSLGTNVSHVAELYNKLADFSLNDFEDIPPPSPTNIKDLFSWVDALHLSASKKSIVDSICGVVLWSLWSFRNEPIFGSSMPKRSIIIDKIIDLSFRRPILLSSLAADFGLIPFKFYNSWLLDSNLQEMVKDFLEHHDHYTSQNPIGIEADENSKFFHATVNQKRRYLSIHEIKHEGHWLSDPSSIKEVFLSFFESKFRRTDVANIVIRSPFYRQIQDDQNVALISPTCEMKIRNAIWDCSSDKSPGPDGFSFAFYKKFWDSLKYDIMGFVQEFFKSSSLPSGCNTSFIAIIPKVLSIKSLPRTDRFHLPSHRFCHLPRTDRFHEKSSNFGRTFNGLHVAIEDAIAAGLYRVLGSLGTYYLSLFPMPITVCKKLESIRARFFWGSDGSTKKLHWIAWNSVTAFKRNGGLGIGSLFSFNPALIQKWRWRFVNHPQSLWVRLITAIHGGVENVTIFFKNISSQSVWGRIVGSINTMHEKGFIPLSTLSRRVNNGADTKFWLESWMHNSPLYQQYPRLFRLALNNYCLVKDCWNNDWHVPWSRPILSGTNASHVAKLSMILRMYGRGLMGRSLSRLNLRGSTLTSVSSPQVVSQLDGIAFSPKRLTFFMKSYA
uniref:RNA-directed DNA polymerase, eukaryota, reverse transcriptase zinc-binding domain protein n=1 Tax=Tanacetum cinerariifolium TaxID=118510 RepID=A0A6L2M5W4_TANCI|nr:RNA-directed DNA polymerase, eukaryota, reverse transcriptase zinc-binding domain protein [Tanacetum cinerariifolium]